MALLGVGAGLGRTGTASLKRALERILGAPCYHMEEVPRHAPEHPVAWAAAYRGDLPDWDWIFDGYVACVDWPAGPLWQPISAAFPDSIILLSSRDPDAWWRSASSTIFQAIEERYCGPNAGDNGWTWMIQGMMSRFSEDWRDEDAAKAAFVAYNDEVRRTAPVDRLVEWQPGDGWQPICERLGVPVPNEPFPHTNTTEEFRTTYELAD